MIQNQKRKKAYENMKENNGTCTCYKCTGILCIPLHVYVYILYLQKTDNSITQ